MARVRYDGLAELIKDLEGYGDDIDQLTEHVTRYATARMIHYWRQYIARHNFIDKRAMIESIKRMSTATRKRPDDKKVVVVAPSGKDSNGVRNAEKAFVLNYGAANKNIPPSGYVDKVADASIDDIQRYAEDQHEVILRRRNL